MQNATWRGRTASVIVLRPVVARAAASGVDPMQLLQEVGLSRADLDDIDRRIPEDVHDRMLREAAARSSDPAFGLHIAENADVGDYGTLEYAMRFSESLSAALSRAAEFGGLLADCVSTHVSVTDDALHVRRAARDHGAHSEIAYAAFFVRRARDLTRPDQAPRMVRLRHPRPADAATLAAYRAFFACPLAFDADNTEIAFDRSSADEPVTPLAPGLVEVLDRYMRECARRVPVGDRFVDRVHQLVGAEVRAQKRPSLTAAAAALHMSPRSLQRRLRVEGTSFHDVVGAVRHSGAEHLLTKNKLSITEIAFLLGFSDVGGFERSFKRRSGKTPSAFRAALHDTER